MLISNSLRGSTDSKSLAVLNRLGSNQIYLFFDVPLLPEALCLLCEGSWVPSIGWLIQLGQQCLAGLLARVVRKLDRNGFGGTWWLLTVKTLDGLLSLNSPIKTNETNSSGNAWGEDINIRLVICWVTLDSHENMQYWQHELHRHSLNSSLGVKKTKQFIGVYLHITNLKLIETDELINTIMV